MGHGGYTASDWSRLAKSRRLESSTTNEIFSNSELKQKYDPRFINQRESRDSEEHPCSTPIIIGVDVTGSMGYLSTQIIKESLNELMLKLYASDLVKDPQLMFAAIGDVVDEAPLQVTQFESDIRIAEQLMDLWLEGRGGDEPEDYELLWYFAAKHTDIDSYKKRGKKGYCFSIGDASCHNEVSKNSIKKVFDDVCQRDYESSTLAEMASEKYELFHIMIGANPQNFPELIPGRVLLVTKQDIKYLPEIIISAIQLAEGVDYERVVNQWGTLAKRVVKNALKLICINNTESIVF